MWDAGYLRECYLSAYKHTSVKENDEFLSVKEQLVIAADSMQLISIWKTVIIYFQMKLLTAKLQLISRLALLVLMLAAQGAAYAHEIGHFESGNSNFCEICSIGSSLDNAVTISHDIPTVQSGICSHSLSTFVAVFDKAAPTNFARAPPLSQ